MFKKGGYEVTIGQEFNQAINKNVLNEISHAMTSLHSELLYEDKETAKETIEEMVEEAKKVVNCYIDEQKTTLLKLIDVI